MLRGFQFTPETVRDWEERFIPHCTEQIRTKRKDNAGKVWLVDETFIRVKCIWCYLSRGIPCTTNPVVQSYRRIKHRDYPTLSFGEFEAAQRFCRAVDEVGNLLRPRSQLAEFLCLRVGEASLSENRRERFVEGVKEMEAIFQTFQTA